MTESNDDSQPLERRIAATLDAGCTRMDQGTVQRLDQARRKALRQSASARQSWRFGPALAAACLLIVALVVLLRPPFKPAPMPMTGDLDLLTRPEFEAFLEEPEFFAWVAQREICKQPRPGEEEEHSG